MTLDQQNLQQLKQTAELIYNDKCLLDALRNAGYENMTRQTIMIVNNALTSTERKIEHVKNRTLDQSIKNDPHKIHRNEKNDDSPSPDF